MTTWWPWVRIATAVLLLAALARQMQIVIVNALASPTAWGSHLPTVTTNFFSYFTILSNLSAAVVLIIAAVHGIRHRSDRLEPAWLTTALVCVSTYMIVTGIVYNILLRQYPVAGISDVWTNESLHLMGPLLLLADVLFAPRRRALPWRALWIVAAFPVVWAVYTLVRADAITGPMTGDPYWYPYPFLNPHLTPGGYVGVAGYIVGIAIAIIAVGAGVVWVSRRRAASLSAVPAATAGVR